jgi:hypothetical protein
VEQQIMVARANERWVVVGIMVAPIVGTGWEGKASFGELGAQGPLRRPGQRQGRLRQRAVCWSVMASDMLAAVN